MASSFSLDLNSEILPSPKLLSTCLKKKTVETPSLRRWEQTVWSSGSLLTSAGSAAWLVSAWVAWPGVARGLSVGLQVICFTVDFSTNYYMFVGGLMVVCNCSLSEPFARKPLPLRIGLSKEQTTRASDGPFSTQEERPKKSKNESGSTFTAEHVQKEEQAWTGYLDCSPKALSLADL